MELRSCNHLHFIQAVKGGVLTKHLNVYRGRPALKFKQVKDLYEFEDTTSFVLLPAFRPKFEHSSYPIECDRAKAESLCVSTGETTEISGETSMSNSKGNDGEAGESDDHNFGNMTLKQIKDRCKEKKRKQSKYVEVKEETTETCSLGEQNHFGSQSEDEFDIMEPLSCWKSRILNEKTKRKCRHKSVFASSQNVLSVVKCEEIMSDQVIIQEDENFSAPIATKVEVAKPASSGCKDSIVNFVESPLSHNEPMISCQVVSSEELKTANCYDLAIGMVGEDPYTAKHHVSETGMSVIPGEELATSACGLKTYVPSLLSDEPQCDAVNEESREAPGRASDFFLDIGIWAKPVGEFTTNAGGFETQLPPFFSDEPPCHAAREESYGHVKHADLKSAIDIQASHDKQMINDVSEAIYYQLSDLSLLEAKKEDSVIEHQANDIQKTVCSSKDHIPISYNDPQSFPCVYLQSQKTSINSQVQVPDVSINNAFESEDLSKSSGLCLPEDEAKDVSLHVHASIISSPVRDCSSLLDSNLKSSPKGSSVWAVDHSTGTEEKRSLSSACADAAKNCPAGNYSCIDEPVVSAKVDSLSKLQHPPERLFATRMAISPTSQKKLREAMESTELDDEQYYKYARKLFYRNLMENKIGRVEGGNQIKRNDVITSPKKALRKPKIDNNGFHYNSNVPVPCGSRVGSGTGTGCSYVQSCSESAILFSQQQLRDIESVATKLSKELQFMKDIAEQTLQCQVNPDTSLRNSEDEIRIAIQNATRAEENAKRALSIMARNCSRFCKIMKLSDKGSSLSRNMVRKKRKIVFADEAGGKLCDVKTFENDVCSFYGGQG